MERITYKGRIYTRDPNAKTQSRRIYFRRMKYDSKSKKYIQTILHRVIWEDHYGAIPWDHIIHHKDGDSNNNELSNLECIPLRDHLSKYHQEGKYKNAQDKTCHRCGITFKAKTKRSRFCKDCNIIFAHSSIEYRRWHPIPGGVPDGI